MGTNPKTDKLTDALMQQTEDLSRAPDAFFDVKTIIAKSRMLESTIQAFLHMIFGPSLHLRAILYFRLPMCSTGRSLETFSFRSCFSRTHIRLSGVTPKQLCRSVRKSGRDESVTTQQSESVQSTGSESKAVIVIIKGKVQGVFCRNWTVENAKKLNLNGLVRNCWDGSAEVIFSGTSSAVEDMVQKCHSVPSSARLVASVFPSGTMKCHKGLNKNPHLGKRIVDIKIVDDNFRMFMPPAYHCNIFLFCTFVMISGEPYVSC